MRWGFLPVCEFGAAGLLGVLVLRGLQGFSFGGLEQGSTPCLGGGGAVTGGGWAWGQVRGWWPAQVGGKGASSLRHH